MAMVMLPGGGALDATEVLTRGRGEVALTEGAYLVEAIFPRLATAETCERAFTAMGWEDVIIDESPRKDASTFARFVGKVAAGSVLRIASTEAVEWAFVQRLPFDPYADIHKEAFAPFKLVTNKRVAVRFLSRLGRRDMRGPAIARDVVERLLVSMGPRGGEGGVGFEVHKLAQLRQNMRLPDRPGAGQALWVAIVTWRPKDAILTIQDPLCFEDMEPVD